MNITLSVGERLAAIAIFNNPENKVSTDKLKVYIDDVDKFRITEEDQKKVGWKQDVDDNGNEMIRWEDNGKDMKEIELDSFTYNFLKEKSSKMELAASDPMARYVSRLVEKLK